MTLSLIKFGSLFIGKNFMKKILLLNLLFVGILYSQDSELENVEEVVVNYINLFWNFYVKNFNIKFVYL